MSGINNNETNQQQQAQVPIYTRDDVNNILREFERQRDEQRELSYKGKQLPEGIREILDTTPTSDLKDDIRRYKKQIPRYNHEGWTKNPQLNKEFIDDLKKCVVKVVDGDFEDRNTVCEKKSVSVVNAHDYISKEEVV
jgi:hypothetical protein